MPSSGNVFSDLGISEPDVEIAKADLAIRVQRLAEHRRLTPKEAAALLKVAESELPTLFQGRLASCSLDQLLRMLTWLGDDVEIIIRPRLQRTKRGAIRVAQVAAVERPDDFEPVHTQRRQRSAMSRPPDVSPDHNSTSTSGRRLPSDDRQLLDKHALEKMTSLDITTIYRKMAAGTFPQPVKVGRRRVAWRASDVMAWQQDLEVGTETLRWRAAKSLGDGPGPGAKRRRRK
jgi:predicted DNA-binding transcriptional regulator AlpA/predicted XRE-type DNA-binding protein